MKDATLRQIADYEVNATGSPEAKTVTYMKEIFLNHVDEVKAQGKLCVPTLKNGRNLFASGLIVNFPPKNLIELNNGLCLILQKEEGGKDHVLEEKTVAELDKILESKCITTIRYRKSLNIFSLILNLFENI